MLGESWPIKVIQEEIVGYIDEELTPSGFWRSGVGHDAEHVTSVGKKPDKVLPFGHCCHRGCPLCKVREENVHHFLHCHKNPNCKKSIKTMVKTILKDDHPSRPAFASCLEQYLATSKSRATEPISQRETSRSPLRNSTRGNRRTNVNWLASPPATGIHIKLVAAPCLHGLPHNWLVR